MEPYYGPEDVPHKSDKSCRVHEVESLQVFFIPAHNTITTQPPITILLLLLTLLLIKIFSNRLSIKFRISLSEPSERGLVLAVESVMEVDNSVIALHVLVQEMLQIP